MFCVLARAWLRFFAGRLVCVRAVDQPTAWGGQKYYRPGRIAEVAWSPVVGSLALENARVLWHFGVPTPRRARMRRFRDILGLRPPSARKCEGFVVVWGVQPPSARKYDGFAVVWGSNGRVLERAAISRQFGAPTAECSKMQGFRCSLWVQRPRARTCGDFVAVWGSNRRVLENARVSL